MRIRGWLGVGFVMVALLTGGCDTDDVDGDAGVDAGAPMTDAGPPPEGMVLRGTVNDFINGSEVVDMEVCVLDTTTCTTTDASGAFTLFGIPEATNVAIGFSKLRYLTTIFPMHLTTDAVINVLALSDAAVRTFESQLSIDFDDAAGHLSFALFEDGAGVPGATLSGDPGLGTPVYMSEVFALDSALTETTTGGRAGYINAGVVAETDVTITLPAGVSCERPSTAWPGTGHTYTLPMRADAMSSILSLVCMSTP